jgi:hypothetical protein
MGQTILAGRNYRLCVGANPTDPTKKKHIKEMTENGTTIF